MRLKRPELTGRFPRAVYFYDCHLKPNPTRPKYFTVGHHLCVEEITPMGKENTALTDAKKRRLLNASGLKNTDAVDDALEKHFPPTLVTIPWDKLWPLFAGLNSFRIIAWVGYSDMLLRPKPALGNDRYLLSIPSAVRFERIITDICPAGHMLSDPGDTSSSTVVNPNGKKAVELEKEFQKHLADLKKRQPVGLKKLGNSLESDSRKRRDAFRKKLRKRMEEFQDW